MLLHFFGSVWKFRDDSLVTEDGNSCWASTSAGLEESGSACSSTDSVRPSCRHSASFCTGTHKHLLDIHPEWGLTCVLLQEDTHLVTHKVFWHWVTSVSLSSSLWGRTVISSRVLGRAQNSRFTGPTCLLVQLAMLMRPMGLWHQEGKNTM